MDFLFGISVGLVIGIVIGMLIYREGYTIAREHAEKDVEKGPAVQAWIK